MHIHFVEVRASTTIATIFLIRDFHSYDSFVQATHSEKRRSSCSFFAMGHLNLNTSYSANNCLTVMHRQFIVEHI
jgi:hypothetical protein